LIFAASVPKRAAANTSRGSPLFNRRENLVAQSITLIERCDCRAGCPGCVGPNLAIDEEATATPKALARSICHAIGARAFRSFSTAPAV